MSRDKLGQSINLSVDILPLSSVNRPKPRNGVDRTHLGALNYITVHETDNSNAGADAQAHRRFVNNGGGQHRVSWHYTVDESETVKHLRLNERGIHANSGNWQSVGIETCVNDGADLSQTRDRAARLVALLLHDTGLSLDRVVQHNFWSGKHCPRKLRDGVLGMNWGSFKELVEQYLEFASLDPGLADMIELEAEPDMRIDDLSALDLAPANGLEEDDGHNGMPEEFLSVTSPLTSS